MASPEDGDYETVYGGEVESAEVAAAFVCLFEATESPQTSTMRRQLNVEGMPEVSGPDRFDLWEEKGDVAAVHEGRRCFHGVDHSE